MEHILRRPELNPSSLQRRVLSTVVGLTSLALASLPHPSSAQEVQNEVLIFCVREDEMVPMSSPGSENPRINGEEYSSYYAVIAASPEESVGAVVKYRLPVIDRSSRERLIVSETISEENLRVVRVSPSLGGEFQQGVGFLTSAELLRAMTIVEMLEWLPFSCFPPLTEVA